MSNYYFDGYKNRVWGILRCLMSGYSAAVSLYKKYSKKLNQQYSTCWKEKMISLI